MPYETCVISCNSYVQVLADIEIAQAMQNEKVEEKKAVSWSYGQLLAL
jgi:hypothetical protein